MAFADGARRPGARGDVTIVASFMPLAYLPGAPGEFIRAMSYTVAIALLVSFAVAMLLTPMLAVTLVKTGLHATVVNGVLVARRSTSCSRSTSARWAQRCPESD